MTSSGEVFPPAPVAVPSTTSPPCAAMFARPTKDVRLGADSWPGATPEFAATMTLAAFAGASTQGDWVLTTSQGGLKPTFPTLRARQSL